MKPTLPGRCFGILREQAGMISRAQALAEGMTAHAIQAKLDGRHWQRIHRGVYAAFTGRPPRLAMMWAAVLAAGRGAVLSHQTAAELHGLLSPDDSRPIHVTVPSGHRVAPLRQVVLHYSQRAVIARHPALLPPRTRLEESVVDLAESARTLNDAISWVLSACGSRRTTPERLRKTMQARARLRRRKHLLAVVDDAQAGVQSILEHSYLYRVERPHGLPCGVRQWRSQLNGVTRYEDVRYEKYAVIVELDGRAAHPEAHGPHDMRRDNASSFAGLITLRYSYADVIERPCEVAAEVALVLRNAGYTRGLRRCGPQCTATGSGQDATRGRAADAVCEPAGRQAPG